MKNIFSLVFFIIFAIGFGQESALAKKEPGSIEVQPEPIEGFTAFYKNIQNRIKIPENELDGKYKTIISFIVDTDGILTDFKIIQETPKSIGLGEQVINILKTFPKWKPGTKKKYFNLPVSIVIENDESKPKKE